MLPTKNAALINRILDHIEAEEAAITRLKSFRVKSKAINALKTKHETNIKELVAVLDAREAEDQ